MDKKLSFILPVYKVEAYLPQCLDSILNQTTEECEVVLVDDGSPDNSGAICDEYAKRYSNVKVTHIPNGGNSAARNLGVDMAEGKYVCFVDSDDYIDSRAVPKLLHWIDTQDADICFLQATKVFPDGTLVPLGEGMTREGLRGKTREAALAFMAACPKYPGGPWAKLIRRQLLLDHNIRFPGDRRLCEDLFYTLDIYMAAERFDALDFPYYYYRQNVAGSITSTITPRYYFDKARFVTYVAETYSRDKKPGNSEGESALSFAAYEYAILIWHLLCMTGEDWDRAHQFLRDYRWVLKYGKSTKTKLIHMMVSVLGLRLTARVLDVYLKHR